jgi:hypothetical protein
MGTEKVVGCSFERQLGQVVLTWGGDRRRHVMPPMYTTFYTGPHGKGRPPCVPFVDSCPAPLLCGLVPGCIGGAAVSALRRAVAAARLPHVHPSAMLLLHAVQQARTVVAPCHKLVRVELRKGLTGELAERKRQAWDVRVDWVASSAERNIASALQLRVAELVVRLLTHPSIHAEGQVCQPGTWELLLAGEQQVSQVPCHARVQSNSVHVAVHAGAANRHPSEAEEPTICPFQGVEFTYWCQRLAGGVRREQEYYGLHIGAPNHEM